MMQAFNYYGCNFRADPSREGTGRVTMFRHGINNSYTIECSFLGPWR